MSSLQSFDQVFVGRRDMLAFNKNIPSFVFNICCILDVRNEAACCAHASIVSAIRARFFWLSFEKQAVLVLFTQMVDNFIEHLLRSPGLEVLTDHDAPVRQ